MTPLAIWLVVAYIVGLLAGFSVGRNSRTCDEQV